MKRTLITFVAVMFAAGAVSAGTISGLSADKATYNPGETITISGVLDIAPNTDLAQLLGNFFLDLGWDSSKASVIGASQTITVATAGSGASELEGPAGGIGILFIAPANPLCLAASCGPLQQTWGEGTAGFIPGPQQVSFQLQLLANVQGLLGENILSYNAISGFGSDTNPANVGLGANWGGVEIVPEPTTAAMLGLGLLGLGIAGRRR